MKIIVTNLGLVILSILLSVLAVGFTGMIFWNITGCPYGSHLVKGLCVIEEGNKALIIWGVHVLVVFIIIKFFMRLISKKK